MVDAAIHGRGEEGRVLPAEPARQVRRAGRSGLQHRLADHPAHRHGRQHERQQEGHAEELLRLDLGVEQQRQAEGDGIFHQDRQARRRPCCSSAFQKYGSAHICRRLSRPLNLRPVGDGRFQSVKAMKRPKSSGKDHQRQREQHGGQHEERALALLAAHQDLAPAQADGPEHIGIERRAPVGEAEGGQSPCACSACNSADERQKQRPIPR